MVCTRVFTNSLTSPLGNTCTLHSWPEKPSVKGGHIFQSQGCMHLPHLVKKAPCHLWRAPAAGEWVHSSLSGGNPPPRDWPWSKYALFTESWAGPPDQSQRMRVHAPSDHLKSCAGGQGVYAHDDTIWHHDIICDLGMEPPSVCICPGTNPNANSVLISIWANALQGLMSIILSKLINLLIVQLVIACNCHLWRYNLTTFTSKKLSDFQASQLSFCYLFPQCLSSIVFSLFSAWFSSLWHSIIHPV